MSNAPASPAKRSGGSVTLEARGLRRGGGENALGDPEQFCVVDGPNPGDITASALRKRFADNPVALAIIRGALDNQRAAEPAPPHFWHACRAGIEQAIKYAAIEDAQGVVLVVADGRHRKDAVIKVRAEKVVLNDLVPIDLPSLALRIPQGKSEEVAERAYQMVRKCKINSNIRAPMKPSHNAARAVEVSNGGAVSDYAVGVTIGLHPDTAEQEAGKLITLGLCCVEIQNAVDAGAVSLDAIAKWRAPSGDLRKGEAEQREWLAAKLAPRERKANGGAGVTASNGHAVKPLRPKQVSKLYDDTALPDAMRELLAVVTGKIGASAVTDADLRAALLRAGIGVPK